MHETHVALRGQNAPLPGTRPGLPPEPAPEVRLEAAARALVVDGLPTFALPVLAGSAGEAIDSGANSFLLQKQLAPVVEEEEVEAQLVGGRSRVGRVGASSATPLARPITGTAARARPPGTLLRASRLSGVAGADAEGEVYYWHTVFRVSTYILPPLPPG